MTNGGELYRLLARLGSPKLELEDEDSQKTLVLSMIGIGNKLDAIRNIRVWDVQTHRDVVSFEKGTYTDVFEGLYEMP